MIEFALLALAVSTGENQSADRHAAPVHLAQIQIERRAIVRIAPTVPKAKNLPSIKLWKEKDGPKCVAMSALAGLMISKPDSIDLVLRGGQVLRARLEKGCPSIDFYSGFYIAPTRDGSICRKRDTIHSRTGGTCAVEKFKTLLPPK